MLDNFGIIFLKVQIESFERTGHLALCCNGKNCLCSNFDINLAKRNLKIKTRKYLYLKCVDEIKKEK